MVTAKNIAEAILITEMTSGTAEALGGDVARTTLANFVNGVRIALLDPAAAKRLSDAAERLIAAGAGTGPLEGAVSDDSVWDNVVAYAQGSLAFIDERL